VLLLGRSEFVCITWMNFIFEGLNINFTLTGERVIDSSLSVCPAPIS
jgi:hypothetical protein